MPDDLDIYDGLELVVGSFANVGTGPNQLDIESLPILSNCFYEELGGYSAVVNVNDNGIDGSHFVLMIAVVEILFLVENTQCAVLTAASFLVPLEWAFVVVG